MLHWVLIFAMPLIILLIVEELTLFLLGNYLKRPEEKQASAIIRIFESAKQSMQKFRKNPSH
jgi:hypothetical protein